MSGHATTKCDRVHRATYKEAAKGAVPFSRFCEKGTVPFALPEKGTAPVSIQPETGAAPFSSPAGSLEKRFKCRIS